MKNITIEQLESLGACNSGLNLFKEYCGNSIEVTEDNARKVGRFLDVNWASENLLTKSQFLAYEGAKAPLLKAYEEANEHLLKAYEEANEPLLKAYEEAKEPLWEAYEEAEGTLYKAYKEANEPLYKAYEEAKALELVKAYNNDF